MRTRSRKALGTATAVAVVVCAGFLVPHLIGSREAGLGPDTEGNPSTPAVSHASGAAPTGTAARTTEALRALAVLLVSDSYVSGYERAAFGPAWADTDHNGCDTRNDVLRADLTAVAVKSGTNGCVVLSGTLSDPYTAQTIRFVRGYRTSELVPIDHVVPLGWAWQHGAATWTAARREQFANDLAELQPVDEASNTAKSDSGPADWMPHNAAYRCTYDTRWVQLLITYRLSIDTADKTSIDRTLTGCL